MVQHVRLALVGMGFVNRALLQLIDSKATLLRERHNLSFGVTGVADSTGAAFAAGGFNLEALLAHKETGNSVGCFPGGKMGMSALDMVARADADLVVEASIVNLETGQPGLDCVRTALRREIGVVLANKGPLIHAFSELTTAAQEAGVGLAYSATVCGALPVVNIGQRDLVGCDFRVVRGVFNATSNYVLGAMARGGSYDRALRQAQVEGVAEADPTLDVEGWDTANKLVIIANSVLRQEATLADLDSVTGVTGITSEAIRAARAKGQVIKLVATAERVDGHYRLRVGPEWLPEDDFLASVNDWEMGIVFDADIMGLQQYKVDERGPIPTAAAVLRDMVNLATAC